MLKLILISLMLKHELPEQINANSVIEANKKRPMPRKIDWGICFEDAVILVKAPSPKSL